MTNPDSSDDDEYEEQVYDWEDEYRFRMALGNIASHTVRDLVDEDYQNFTKTFGRVTMYDDEIEMKEYAPVVFSYMRMMEGIDYDSFKSGCVDKPFTKFLVSRSGNVVFVSADRRFVLKTITKKECVNLRKILKNYYKHVIDNPNTILVRIFGVFRLRTITNGRPNQNQLHFLVMNNIFYTRCEINELFDLKGILPNGPAVSEVFEENKPDTNDRIKRDIDFTNTLFLDKATKEEFAFQLETAVKFLCSVDIIDYSFVLGIHNCNSHTNPKDYENVLNNKKIRTVMSADKRKVYFIAIIDFFHTYDLKKSISHTFKSFKKRASVLSIPPQLYAERIVKFIEDHIEVLPSKSDNDTDKK